MLIEGRSITSVMSNLILITFTNNIVFGFPIFDSLYGKESRIYPTLANLAGCLTQLPFCIVLFEILDMKRKYRKEIVPISDSNLEEVSLKKKQIKERDFQKSDYFLF
eukprot:Anaeramoba_ignava/c19968_g1_i4.p1 GENE.c19968_g1_i4~~c19968_g1_i4.p1  ORF type:complete len:107 (-),score=34.49 c19968_g1_i4:262-582(-)